VSPQVSNRWWTGFQPKTCSVGRTEGDFTLASEGLAMAGLGEAGGRAIGPETSAGSGNLNSRSAANRLHILSHPDVSAFRQSAHLERASFVASHLGRRTGICSLKRARQKGALSQAAGLADPQILERLNSMSGRSLGITLAPLDAIYLGKRFWQTFLFRANYFLAKAGSGLPCGRIR
jgi:hypothetical protein